MNGKAAKRLRGVFGTGAQYREAKRQLDAMPTSLAQRPKLAKERARKPSEGAAPTWPRTDNQKAQHRPLIVVSPYRATAAGWPKKLVDSLLDKPKRWNATQKKNFYGMLSKVTLDRLAVRRPKEV